MSENQEQAEAGWLAALNARLNEQEQRLATQQAQMQEWQNLLMAQQAQIQQQEAELARLRAAQAPRTPVLPPFPTSESEPVISNSSPVTVQPTPVVPPGLESTRPPEKEKTGTSRRRLLKNFGKMAAGVTALVAASAVTNQNQQAQAATGDGTALTIGQTNKPTATSTTSLQNNSSTKSNVLFKVDNFSFGNDTPIDISPSYKVGITGTSVGSTNADPRNQLGLLGVTQQGMGVYGLNLVTSNYNGSNTAGVYGGDYSTDYASSAGVWGESLKNTGAAEGNGVGVYGASGTGTGVEGDSRANGNSGTGNGTGVYGVTGTGEGVWGSAGGAGGFAVYGTAAPGAYALVARSYSTGGGGAAIYIYPGSGAGVATPNERSGSPKRGMDYAKSKASAAVTQAGPPTGGTHYVGEIVSDSSGRLYYCASTGIPGTWGQISPVVYLQNPVRILGKPAQANDPFVPASPNPGAPTIQYYLIEGGTIPAQATAIQGTLVVYGAAAGGYFSIYPANVTLPPPVVTTVSYAAGSYTSSAFSVKVGPIPGNGKLGIAVVSYQSVYFSLDVSAYFL